MPSKRRTGPAPRKRAAGSNQTQKARQEEWHLTGTENDVLGIVLVVLAVALLISLVVPSSAIITSAAADVLTSLFGTGAALVPIALFVFAVTFFMDVDEPFSGRVALGLLLIVLSILTMLSLNVPGADVVPDLVVSNSVARTAGGYVGGALAWILIRLVGVVVGNILLVGLVLVGVVVCGFSISDTVAKLRIRAQEAREALAVRRDERRATKGRAPDAYAPVGSAFDTPDTRQGSSKSSGRGSKAKGKQEAPATSYLGSRKTSVLKRRSTPESDSGASPEPVEFVPFDDEVVRAPQAASPQDGSSRPAQTAETTVVKKGGRNKGRGASSSRPGATAASPSPAQRPGDAEEGYELPPLDMLAVSPASQAEGASAAELEATMQRLQTTLNQFGLSCRVVDYVSGPLVTTFRVEMGEGERVNKVVNLSDDIALTLAAESVRIMPHIPGTSLVGIEIPNSHRENVHLGDVIPFAKGGPLEVAIGRDAGGAPVVADIATMPHLLVAGSTGSGKSVMINSMIMTLLMRTTPKQVRLILVDPKRVEFSGYNGLPHLYVPVVTEPKQAASALAWAVSEMERRLKVFERAGARDIKVYNRMCVSGKLAEMEHPPEPLPYLVVIIDELADLMMVAGKDVEASIVRLAQLARAAGIHLVVATQRPSADVVTGLIKSNIDNRIALKVSSSVDSRVILDSVGAEKLLGNGDMLFKYRGHATRRILGCYTSDAEIESVVDFIRAQAEPDYHEEILTAAVPSETGGASGASAGGASDEDPLVWEAAQIVVDSQLGSTSGLQRQLSVGYARAGRIMDMLAAKGVVGPPNGSKPRDVLLDKEGLEELRAQEAAFREVE